MILPFPPRLPPFPWSLLRPITKADFNWSFNDLLNSSIDFLNILGINALVIIVVANCITDTFLDPLSDFTALRAILPRSL